MHETPLLVDFYNQYKNNNFSSNEFILLVTHKILMKIHNNFYFYNFIMKM